MSSTSVEFVELGAANGFGASLAQAAPSGGRLPLRGSSSNGTPPVDIYSSCSGSQAPAVPASRPPPGNVLQPSTVADDLGSTTPFAVNPVGAASGTVRRRLSGARPDVVRAAAASAVLAAITLLLAAKGASVPPNHPSACAGLHGRHAGGHWHQVWVVYAVDTSASGSMLQTTALHIRMHSVDRQDDALCLRAKDLLRAGGPF